MTDSGTLLNHHARGRTRNGENRAVMSPLKPRAAFTAPRIVIKTPMAATFQRA